MASGIYAIIHCKSGRWYVGQSQDVRRRLRQHRSRLARGAHENRIIQRTWDKYGPEAFDFEVLILAPVGTLDDLEQAYLDDPETSHFNFSHDAIAPWRGIKRSPETRARMSAAQKGRTLSPETKARMGAAGRGRKASDKTKAKMSAAMRGRTISAAHRAKLSAALTGKTRSESHQVKLTAAARERAAQRRAMTKPPNIP